MANLEVFQNGVWSKTQEPIYQVGAKRADGKWDIADASLMTEAQATARLKELQPAPAKAEPAAKKAPAKKKKTVFKRK